MLKIIVQPLSQSHLMGTFGQQVLKIEDLCIGFIDMMRSRESWTPWFLVVNQTCAYVFTSLIERSCENLSR